MALFDRKTIGRLIPYPLIKWGRTIFYAGPHRCDVCGSRIRRMTDTGYGFEALERLQVIGGMRRRADKCPICHSSARHRLIWFWMNQGGRGLRFNKGTRVAHFSPEKGLSLRLSKALSPHYAAYDIEPSRYRHLDRVRYADLAELPIADSSVDLLVCNHVIEHVPDATKALSEVRRVLSDEGVAVLQVPISLKLKETIELPPSASAQERIDQLGQSDHVRLYNPEGFIEALERAGLSVQLFDAFDSNSDLATRWMLDPLEKLYLCRKAKSSDA